MACRFPGGAHSVEEYWRLLVDGRDAIVEVPPARWDVDAFFDTDPDVPGKMNTRWGGFLQQPAEMFDPTFFGIAPREAASMDPQQRILLEVAWEALEDAGLTVEGLAGSATGAFFSVYGPDYSIELHRDRSAIDAYTTVGTVPCLASGRLSFLLDLQGPSLVVDTACSSSLVAVHLAAQSLRTGECRVALAGAASLTLTPTATFRCRSGGSWRPTAAARHSMCARMAGCAGKGPESLSSSAWQTLWLTAIGCLQCCAAQPSIRMAAAA